MSEPDAMLPEMITCEVEIPAPTSGVCDATAGAGSAVLLRGDVLNRYTVYENGSVLIDGANIVCMGCDCSGAPGFEDATVVDCAGAAISPGLINPHDHMTFSEGAPIDHGATRYNHRHGWRGSLSTPQNPHGTGQESSGMRWVELRMALAGVTSVAGSGRALGMVRNLDRLLTEEAALGFVDAEFETFPLNDANETFHAGCQWNYEFSEADVLDMSAYMPHVAEGIDNYAAEEFRCQSTSFNSGRDHTEQNTAHIHSIGLQAADYYRMALDDAQIIWSPRSNISLYGHTAQVTTFDRLGGRISLGTDWTYSGSANLLRELACADEYNTNYLNGHFTDKQLWEMVTINAAITTGTEALIGSIEEGKIADISVFAPTDGRRHHRAVVAAGNADVALVLREGRALTGEADTLAELGETCEPIDVCGAAHAVCATREFGVGFDAIASSVTGGTPAYPAIFCDLPAGEPTCVPSRPAEFTGERTDGDADGDGIADEVDNCPAVFNAPRPIDGGAQPDADADGIGDPCDDTPLLPDMDGDDVDNASDNCPFDPNPDQADDDTDNKGDLCDFCPDLANPDSVCPPVLQAVTTYDVQSGAVPEFSQVLIESVVVTGVSGSAASVQDPAGGPYSGLFIFTGSAPGVAIGDIVDVSGEVAEYFDLTELRNATFTIRGAGTPLVAEDVTVAMAATEEYEGVLVRLTDSVTSDAPWSCAADNPSCADANLWQVNGTSGIVVWDEYYAGSGWAAQMGNTPVTGVLHYRFDRRRIMPRSDADFGN